MKPKNLKPNPTLNTNTNPNPKPKLKIHNPEKKLGPATQLGSDSFKF